VTRVCFDLDGVLCDQRTDGAYDLAVPNVARITEVRRRYYAGEYIIVDSARGSQSGVDWLDITAKQLAVWAVPYHELHVGRKPFADRYVDDRALHPDDFFFEAARPECWPDAYFAKRLWNDSRRLQSFAHEASFLSQHGVSFNGSVCDVGCSTGEFLEAVGWSGPRYGMEISPAARAIAETQRISFDRDILNAQDFFDVVVFRGTLQHVPEPFRYLRKAYASLKPGGHLAILATPNADSLCYRLFGELPVSDPPRNYWWPGLRELTNALTNLGFTIVASESPYLASGYARPVRDALSFGRRLLGIGRADFPWPGNMVNVIARKP
jgi:SAM-dependent methyltransferase